MNDLNKNLADVFDITPIPEETKEKLPVLKTHFNEPDLKQDLTDAYQQSRENLQGLIDQGQEAMQEILNIAKAGQHPRAFEVYGTLLKNVVDANKELLAIQKQMREMDENSKKEKSGTNIDKAIFIGSTAELNKLIKGKD
ncbi:terminase [bacterium]|nr:terminase [Candidatus Elulimicrobium humile]